MIITAEIKNYEGNNLNTEAGKTFFVSPMDIKAAMKNHPAGTVVTMTVEKGTVKGIAPATKEQADLYKKEHQKPAPEAKKSEFVSADKLMKPLVSETISDQEFEALKARGDVAAREKAHAEEMAKISREAKLHQEDLKKRLEENQPAPKVEIPPLPLPPETPRLPEDDQVRQAIWKLLPSDRVGYRISLAGMVNSVIEMKKISNGPKLTYAELEAEVKRDALSLFLWCDGLTTQQLKR